MHDHFLFDPYSIVYSYLGEMSGHHQKEQDPGWHKVNAGPSKHTHARVANPYLTLTANLTRFKPESLGLNLAFTNTSQSLPYILRSLPF